MQYISCALKARFLLLGFALLVSSVANTAVTFIDIWEYRVAGNSILPDELIQQRLSRFTGPARTIEDVEAAIQVLTQEYKNAGFPAVYVEMPPQTVVNGAFKLAVTETTLRRLKISDATYFLPSSVRKSIASLERGRPINLPRLQHDVQRLNTTNPAMKIVPVLTQGPTADTIDLELNVVDEFPLQGAVELNNYNSSNTTDTRLQFELGYTNLWQKHHSWSMTAQTSPEDTDEVRVFSTSYVAPMNSRGAKLALYGVKSDSNTASVSDIRVVGEGFVLGGRYIYPVSAEAGAISTLIAGMDYKDFDENIVVSPGQNAKTPIDYLSFSLQFTQYTKQQDWYDSLSVALTFGVRGIANENDEFQAKRSRGEPNFSVLKAEYERNYPFAQDWLFKFSSKAQLTDTPLVSNEQISAGGITSVKAYYESQISGDSGISGGLSVTTPELVTPSASVSTLKALVYVESAYLTKQDSGIEEDSEDGISGFGIGLRAIFLKDLKVNMDIAQAFESDGSEGQGRINKGDIRATGMIRYEF